MDLARGTIFAGDYRVVQPLSAGGMGTVFIVEQISTGKRRALKCMHRELAYDADSRRHFEQEARVGARIASEHVVEVQAAGIDAATQVPYLVMELLEGETLGQRIARGPMSAVETASVMQQVAHALGAAHDAGVIHRDLKPENVFLAVSRRSQVSSIVKILDFGIAKVTEDHRRTTGGIGTPLWLAPEQTQRGVITPAADVWAMGLLAFTMLTSHTFWRAGEGAASSIADLVKEILFNTVPSASSRAAEVAMPLPQGFDDWFAHCVARDPNARFPNAHAAYAALAPILQAQAPAPASTQQTPAAPPRSNKTAIVILIAISVIVIGVAVAVAAKFLVTPKLTAQTQTPTPTQTLTPTPTQTQTQTPTPSVSAAAVEHIEATVFVISNPELKDQSTRAINGELGDRLDNCLATHPKHLAHGSIVVMAKVRADGTVDTTQELTKNHGPVAQCLDDAIKATTFTGIKKSGDAQFMLSWR